MEEDEGLNDGLISYYYAEGSSAEKGWWEAKMRKKKRNGVIVKTVHRFVGDPPGVTYDFELLEKRFVDTVEGGEYEGGSWSYDTESPLVRRVGQVRAHSCELGN